MAKRNKAVHGPVDGLFLRSCNTGCFILILGACLITIAVAFGIWALQQGSAEYARAQSDRSADTSDSAMADAEPEAAFTPRIPIPDDGEVEYGRLLLEYDKFEDRTTITAPIPLTTVDGKQGVLEVQVWMSGNHWEGSDLSRVRFFLTEFDYYDIMAGGVNFLIELDGEAERVSPESDLTQFGYLDLDQLDRVIESDRIELKWGVLRFEFGDDARSLLREFRQAVEDSRR